MKFSVAGLGKLGASMATAIASRGFDVIGVDVNPAVVECLNNGHAPVYETGLEKTISENKSRITATLNFDEAVHQTDVTFVIVPTPSEHDGSFSIGFAKDAFKKIGQSLKYKEGYHLVVLTSTVMPGSMRYGLVPVIEKESGKICGKDFGVCYSPAFIALGNIIYDFLHPDVVLVGESDEQSGRVLAEDVYAKILLNAPPIQRMSFENAELAKIAVNTFVTTKITFANMLSEICQKMPGGDIDVVSDAIGKDSRIGRKYLTGGTSYGGPCFPRDNDALRFIGDVVGARTSIASTVQNLNDGFVQMIFDELNDKVLPGAKATVLGLSYKPDSNWVEEASGMKIATALHDKGLAVCAFDPLACEMARKELPQEIIIAGTIKAAIEGANIVFVTIPDEAFHDLPLELMSADTGVLVDFWRILQKHAEKFPEIEYVPFGKRRPDKGDHAGKLQQYWMNSEQISVAD